jgi:hypothetical protein
MSDDPNGLELLVATEWVLALSFGFLNGLGSSNQSEAYRAVRLDLVSWFGWVLSCAPSFVVAFSWWSTCFPSRWNLTDELS